MKNHFKIRFYALAITSLIALQLFSQPAGVEVLKYKHYTSYFSTKEHIPIMVEFTLTKDMVACDVNDRTPRSKEKFGPDPAHKSITDLNKDYTRSGFDRGHNMSAADNECDADGMKECFYFSNMTPQPHSFNAGRWEDVEKKERDEATKTGEVIITVGSLGKSETIGEDNVVVPKQMWKVIYTPRTKTYECYLFPDEDDVEKPIADYKVDLSTIEDDAGVTFKDGIATFN